MPPVGDRQREVSLLFSCYCFFLSQVTGTWVFVFRFFRFHHRLRVAKIVGAKRHSMRGGWLPPFSRVNAPGDLRPSDKGHFDNHQSGSREFEEDLSHKILFHLTMRIWRKKSAKYFDCALSRSRGSGQHLNDAAERFLQLNLFLTFQSR